MSERLRRGSISLRRQSTTDWRLQRKGSSSYGKAAGGRTKSGSGSSMLLRRLTSIGKSGLNNLKRTSSGNSVRRSGEGIKVDVQKMDHLIGVVLCNDENTDALSHAFMQMTALLPAQQEALLDRPLDPQSGAPAASGLDVVLELIDEHAADPGVQEAGYRLLAALATSAKAVEAVHVSVRALTNTREEEEEEAQRMLAEQKRKDALNVSGPRLPTGLLVRITEEEEDGGEKEKAESSGTLDNKKANAIDEEDGDGAKGGAMIWDLLRESIHLHMDEVDVLEQTCCAVRNLTHFRQVDGQAAVESGLLMAMHRVLRGYPRCRRVLVHASASVRNMCSAVRFMSVSDAVQGGDAQDDAASKDQERHKDPEKEKENQDQNGKDNKSGAAGDNKHDAAAQFGLRLGGEDAARVPKALDDDADADGEDEDVLVPMAHVLSPPPSSDASVRSEIAIGAGFHHERHAEGQGHYVAGPGDAVMRQHVLAVVTLLCRLVEDILCGRKTESEWACSHNDCDVDEDPSKGNDGNDDDGGDVQLPDEEVLTSLSTTLGSMLLQRGVAEVVAELEWHKFLLQKMRDHEVKDPLHAIRLRHVAQLFRTFSQHTTSFLSQLMELNAIACTLGLMHAWMSDQVIVEHTMCTLRNLACDDQRRAALCTERGHSLVLWAMKTHPRSADLQIQGARVLFAMGLWFPNKETVVREHGISVLLQACKVHTTEHILLETCMATISNLVHGDMSAKQADQIRKQAIPVLLAMIQEWTPHVHAVLIEAFFLSYNLTLTRAKQEFFVRHHMVRTALQCIRHPLNSGNRQVVAHGLQCIGNLVQQRPHAAAAVQLGLVEYAVEMMETHRRDQDVQLHAARVLGLVAVGRAQQWRVGHAGGVQVLVNALDLFPRNEDVCHFVFVGLCNLINNHALQRERLRSMDGIAVTTSRVWYFRDNIRVLQPACKLLTSIVENPEACAVAMEAGAVSTLVEVLSRHTMDVQVCQYALQALGYLTVMDGQAEKFVRCRGVPALTAAMTQHQTRFLLQEACCWTLANVAFYSPDGVDILTKNDGVSLIVRGLSRHPLNAAVQGKGLQALANMTVTTENQIHVFAEGAVGVVLTALKLHVAQQWVQEFGCRTLSNLGIYKENKVAMGEKTITVLLETMRQCAQRTMSAKGTIWARIKKHVANAKIQEYAIRALGHLAAAEPNFKILSQGPGVASMVRTMTTLLDFENVQEHGIRALVNISTHDASGVVLAAAGGSIAVLRAMALHYNKLRIQLNGCILITNLAVSTNNNIHIVQQRGISIILNSIQNHPTSAAIQRHATKAILALIINMPATSEILAGHDGENVIEQGCNRHRNAPCDGSDATEEEAAIIVDLANQLHHVCAGQYHATEMQLN